jgi:hypothetical protein
MTNVIDVPDNKLLIRPAWTSVERALPDTTKKVLATYLNNAGNRRIVIANWVQARTQKIQWEDEEFGISEYDESSDEFFLKEGWYECIENNEEYGMYWIYEGMVTHWAPMPLAPTS